LTGFFAADGVSDIIDALAADESDWAGQQMAMIETKSPTSSAVALRQMRDGAQADFDEAMRIEMRAVTRLMSLPDFYEGVRAIIIEKDNAPQWSPARHGDVTAAQIEGIFASLGDDELAF
jgi:enoyl-CoA hydratase